jgi:uncharacterized membrane protein HdeD (DUF308 family)
MGWHATLEVACMSALSGLMKPVRFRGGREAPRWTLLGIAAVVIGIFLLIAHATTASIVVGIVLLLAGFIVPVVSTRSPAG